MSWPVKDEREYIKTAIIGGRSVADLHLLIDQSAAAVISDQNGAARKVREYEWRYDILREALAEARDALRQFGAIGDEHVKAADKALEATLRPR